MISYCASYHKPKTIDEATALFHTLDEWGKNPVYFAGGTEIITLSRTGRFDASDFIDIKSIDECLIAERTQTEIRLGAALSLTKVIGTKLFPFLNQTIGKIADQTARNKITLGGNICGTIPYKEAVLPFLISNTKAVIAGKDGLKERPLNDLFHKKLTLTKGEFLVQLKVEQHNAKFPYLSIKKRRQWGVGYPLITAVATKTNGQVKTAFSGLCSFPFHVRAIDDSINNKNFTAQERIEAVLQSIPAPILDDVHGSAAYRQFVLGKILEEIVGSFKGADAT